MNPISQQNNLLYDKLRAVIAERKNLRNPLIEILRNAQEMNIPASKIYGVVTFYNFFSMKPRGRHTLNICMGTACFVKGAPRLLQMISDELGVEVGETTSDGRFTVSAVRCVGACSLAPVFVIGEDTFGRIETRDKINEILKKYD